MNGGAAADKVGQLDLRGLWGSLLAVWRRGRCSSWFHGNPISAAERDHFRLSKDQDKTRTSAGLGEL
jgi:hypothetical protein